MRGGRPGEQPPQGTIRPDNAAGRHGSDALFSERVLLGLVLGLWGDVFLVLPATSKVGGYSFLAGHGTYIAVIAVFLGAAAPSPSLALLGYYAAMVTVAAGVLSVLADVGGARGAGPRAGPQDVHVPLRRGHQFPDRGRR